MACFMYKTSNAEWVKGGSLRWNLFVFNLTFFYCCSSTVVPITPSCHSPSPQPSPLVFAHVWFPVKFFNPRVFAFLPLGLDLISILTGIGVEWAGATGSVSLRGQVLGQQLGGISRETLDKVFL